MLPLGLSISGTSGPVEMVLPVNNWSSADCVICIGLSAVLIEDGEYDISALTARQILDGSIFEVMSAFEIMSVSSLLPGFPVLWRLLVLLSSLGSRSETDGPFVLNHTCRGEHSIPHALVSVEDSSLALLHRE